MLFVKFIVSYYNITKDNINFKIFFEDIIINNLGGKNEKIIFVIYHDVCGIRICCL